MDNQLVWRLSNASLSTQSAPSASLITLPYLSNQPYLPSLLTLPYLPNQPHPPHSSPSPICPISPIRLTHHPPLSAQSAPSPSFLTLRYLPNQPNHPHSSPSPICPISPITPTPHPSLPQKQVKVFQKPTLLSYLSIPLFT